MMEEYQLHGPRDRRFSAAQRTRLWCISAVSAHNPPSPQKFHARLKEEQQLHPVLPIRQEAERLTEEAAYELSVLRQAVNSRDTGAGLRVLLGKVRETESDCKCYPPRSSCFLWKQARPLHRACLHPSHGCG